MIHRRYGGLSPVFFTSLSVVTVVVPPGVEIFDSVFVSVFSAQPAIPIEPTATINAVAIQFFMIFFLEGREK
jgi:hypothetical protein